MKKNKNFEQFLKQKGKISCGELDNFFADLEPVEIDELIGKWKGGYFRKIDDNTVMGIMDIKGLSPNPFICHCEEQSDEAIPHFSLKHWDCFAPFSRSQ